MALEVAGNKGGNGVNVRQNRFSGADGQKWRFVNAGGGYYWYTRKQQQREAAQRVAKQKVDRQNRAMAGKENAAKPSGPVSAQNAAKVRTGSYTGGQGAAKPKATPSRPSAVSKTAGQR